MQGASMKQGFFFGLLATIFAVNSAWAQPQLVDNGAQVQIGRYTTQGTVPPPELVNPLSVYAQLNFPRQTVQTVGQALDYTLMRTGYRLVERSVLSDQARGFLELTLPESQRQVGPYPVQAILTTLLGTSWRLKQDPITRQVWFELPAQPIAKASEETKPEGAATANDKAVKTPARWHKPAKPEDKSF
jgi:type IV pili sensor histidine kinase/response regulator